MLRELLFLPEVDDDFSDASLFYETLSPTRGAARFEAAFRSALDEVRRGTITHRLCFERYHRVLLRRFPYTLYYRLRNDRTVIVGLLYSRFSPARTARLLNRRE